MALVIQKKEGPFAKRCHMCFTFQTRITARTPESCAIDVPHNLLSSAYPFPPWGPLTPSPELQPTALITPKFQFLFFSNSIYPSWIRSSLNFSVHPRPILFDPENYLEHQLTLSLLSTSNLLLQTSFCLKPSASLLFHLRISTAIPHFSMVRNPKCCSPGSNGFLALPLWIPHLCLNHLPISTPTTMNLQGTLNPPSSTTAAPPLSLPQSEWPTPASRRESLNAGCSSQKYTFKLCKGQKVISILGKPDAFRHCISLLLLYN